jgi:hypothetical protein
MAALERAIPCEDRNGGPDMMAAWQKEATHSGEGCGPDSVLLGESIFREDGQGPTVALGDRQGRLLLLTLHINRVIDQQSLEVSIWGSADGLNWDLVPILSLPRKYYCGSYEVHLDLSSLPHVQCLRAKWSMSRWARDARKPLFAFHISMRDAGRSD